MCALGADRATKIDSLIDIDGGIGVLFTFGASPIWVSNREPSEWLAMPNDALLVRSAVDRLTSGAHTLVVEGPSYRQRRQRERVAIDTERQVRHPL